MGQDARHTAMKVVWILGAGFSIPLGGPAFRQLISTRTLRTLRHWWQPSASADTLGYVGAVYHLYQAGLRRKDGPDGLWDDAEDFLERLESASRKPNGAVAHAIQQEVARLRNTDDVVKVDEYAAQAMHNWLQDIPLIHREAVRFVAGACSWFLRDAEEDPATVDTSERWDPYRRWSEKLCDANATVITFNYDRALDILGEFLMRKHKKSLFISPVGQDPDFFEALAPQCVPVYHLHGHVGWRLDEETRTRIVRGKIYSTGQHHEPALAHRYPEGAVIGLPGREKGAMPEGLLRGTWDRAMLAIEEAGAVVFVGYRFPETDNIAKRGVIDALKANPDAMVHVVLGANNPETPRVQAMLEWTRPKERVRVHPLWAQDFLAVFERDDLFE